MTELERDRSLHGSIDSLVIYYTEQFSMYSPPINCFELSGNSTRSRIKKKIIIDNKDIDEMWGILKEAETLKTLDNSNSLFEPEVRFEFISNEKIIFEACYNNGKILFNTNELIALKDNGRCINNFLVSNKIRIALVH